MVEAVSFKQAAVSYMAAHEAGWRNIRDTRGSGRKASSSTPIQPSAPCWFRRSTRRSSQGVGADLALEIGDRKSGARAHEVRAGLGKGARLPHRGEPSPVARPSREPAACARQNPEGQAPSSPAVPELGQFMAGLIRRTG